ncbi:UNVERIFIED_CONTAM: hypothetical protein GTU68_005928 [Idotea baltica]|nr:hypothetical protein [Idotea baltica]
MRQKPVAPKIRAATGGTAPLMAFFATNLAAR